MLTFRKAEAKDMMLYFEWVNEKLVRSQSFSTKPISLDDHKKWFFNKIKDQNTIMLVFSNGVNKIGQIRIEKYSKKKAKIGISIEKKHRGKNFAFKMIDIASSYFLDNNTDFALNAFIKESNKRSIKSFEKAGYYLFGSLTNKKNKSFHFIRKIK